MTAKLRRLVRSRPTGISTLGALPPRSKAAIQRHKGKIAKASPPKYTWSDEQIVLAELDDELRARLRLDQYKKDRGSMPMHEIKRRLGNARVEGDPFALVVIDGREALIKIQLYDRDWAETVTLAELRKIAIYG